MKPSSKWNMFLTTEEQQSIERALEAYHDDFVFQQLGNIIKTRMKELDKAPDYDSPSWAYHQAHRNGQRDALKEILQLLPISSKERPQR